MHTSKILVVGSFVQDLTFATRSFPRPGETIVGTFSTGPGGKGSNQAVAARRAGSEVTFIGAVGKDEFAHSVRDFYRNEGIESPLAEYPDSPTGTAAILFDETGQNEIVVALGANEKLDPTDIPDDQIATASIVVCQLECNLQAVTSVLQRAKDHEVTRILNPAPLREECTAELLREADILIPNETEFIGLLSKFHGIELDEAELPKLSPEKFNEYCRKLDCPTVLVTLGKHGVHLSTPESWERIAAVENVQVVDTTGAGDSFVGAFAAGLQRYNGNLKKAATFANRAAAISVTRKGTAPAMPTLDEIELVAHSS